MNITQRFSLMVKSSFSVLLDSIEDPERSLHQLILDMEDELEAAKRAAAKAMANEDRLRARVAFHDKDSADWETAARRAMTKGDEASARAALERAEQASRQSAALSEQLAIQGRETAEVRESIGRMQEQVGSARSRLQLLQAKLRQGEARKAVSKVMRRVETRNLGREFDRLADGIDQDTAVERAYQRLDDQLNGDDLRAKVAKDAIDDAVASRLERLRAEAAPAAEVTAAEVTVREER